MPKRRQPEKAEQAQIVKLLRSLGAAVYVLGTRRPKGDYQGTRQTAYRISPCVDRSESARGPDVRRAEAPREGTRLSWWLNVPREDWQAKVEAETDRMRGSKFGVLLGDGTYSPHMVSRPRQPGEVPKEKQEKEPR